MPASPVRRAIDVHAHCVPHDLLQGLPRDRRSSVTVERHEDAYVVTFAGGPPLRPISGLMLDGADRHGWFDAHDVGMQFVAPWLDLQGQDLGEADGAAWATTLNDHMADLAERSEGRLLAHASLHLANPRRAAEELHRTVAEQGLRSVMLPASLRRGTSLADPEYDDLWTAASELHVMVMLHATTGSQAMRLLDHYPSLAGMFGRNIEVSLSAAELIVAGVLDRHPDLRLLLVHGGGFLPYLAGRFDNDARRMGWPSTLPSEAMRELYFDTVLLAPPAIQCLCAVVEPCRVMLGSDLGSTPNNREGVGVVDAVLDSRLDGESQAAILYGNAARLFDVAV
jgi:aminocarboxymuconate-semialdehyde decarboxylase